MQIFKHLKPWQTFRDACDRTHLVGFIPTMGNLHDGHAALIQQSIKENTITVVSIFVNPTQFNRQEDLDNYPKTIEEDLNLLKTLGVDACLLPDYQSLYADNFHFRVEEHHLSALMEGPMRPGHFTGVLTIVLKLLMLIKPHCAYFGEKDYQQYQLIDRMAQAFFLPTKIIAHPTIREPDQLPYSSRNARLTQEQRQKAGHFAQIFHQPMAPLSEINEALQRANINVEYLEEHQGRRYIAVMIDTIRLIDNYACHCPQPVI